LSVEAVRRIEVDRKLQLLDETEAMGSQKRVE
jgi:hypothetical protein